MSDLYRDPAKEPSRPAKWESAEADAMDWACEIPVGPGGVSTFTENNERGILDRGLFKVIAKNRNAALGSDHDSYAQGIYRDGSKYRD